MQNISESHKTQVQEYLNPLMQWDLSFVKNLAVEKGLYCVDEIDEVELEYKRWLSIALATGDNLAISKKVDDFWHTHILFSQDYYEMCMRMNGAYIHHRPCVLDDPNDLDKAFAQITLAHYRKYFGEPNPKYWDTVMCTCQISD